MPRPINRVGGSPDGVFNQDQISHPCDGTAPCESMVYNAAQVAITADGDLGDWDVPTSAIFGQTAFLPHNTANSAGTLCCGGAGTLTIFDEYNGGVWNGIDDHSAAFAVAWSTTDVYLGLKVIDDTHQLNGLSGWNGDSVQIVLADAGRTTVTHLYNYAIAQETDDHVTHHESGPGGTEAAITRYESGRGAGAGQGTTIYEVRLPASTWGIPGFQAGICAGVGLTFNDGDTEAGQGGQKGWSGWGPYSAVCASTT